MKSDYVVNVEYKTKVDNTPVIKSYEFEQYTNMMKFELLKLIMDVENAFILTSKGKNKNEWSEETMKTFQRIRHKLLDQANAIERLPDNLFYKGNKI